MPLKPDLVDLFPKPGVLDEALEVGAKGLWLQLGLWGEATAHRAQAVGRDVVMDWCLKSKPARFRRGLHLAGFDTGVISARRRLR